MFIPPFGPDGSYENLKRIRNIFGKEIEPDEAYIFLICLKGWIDSIQRIPNPETHQLLKSIRDELLGMRKHLSSLTNKKMNSLFIENFYEFFKTVDEQK